MSIQDPISDMLTIIRNGQLVRKKQVSCPFSTKKVPILQVLEDEGYILGFKEVEEEGKPRLHIYLKYHKDKPVIETLRRVSRPALRVYKQKWELPRVLGGFGMAIISTPQGVMSDKKARKLGQGGEVLCLVA